MNNRRNQRNYTYNLHCCLNDMDEEMSLYYYGMRYNEVWLCKFINVDPLLFKYPYYTPFQYAGNKPITYIDLDGAEEGKPEELFFESYSISSCYDNGTTYLDLSWKDIEFVVNGQINYSISARYAFIYPTGEFIKVFETRTTEINTMSLMDNGINSINEIDLMGGLGIVIPQQPYDLPIFKGKIVPVSGLNALELWLETPPNNLGDIFLKMVGNVGYSMLNSPYSYVTWKTISGSYLNSIERTDAFLDFAPGLLFFGLGKTIPVIETAGDGLQTYNKVKNEATKFGHIFKEKGWQKEVSRLYKTNKRNQHLLKDIDNLDKIDSYGFSTTKEISKQIKQVTEN